MSREIKFRAWHKNNKSMCQNVKTDLLDRDYLELMQYTGLKDINGKEIYEGDIVRDNSLSDDKDYNYEIVFEEGAFITKWLGDFDDYLYEVKNELEIIGNIYENSELL